MKAIQMKPEFEVYVVSIFERMDMDLMQFKLQNKLGVGFFKELHRFFVDYLAAAEKKEIHYDIKPRLEFEQ